MRPDLNDPSLPGCAQDARSLGVRAPRDVKPDDDGNVHPGTGGMSVSPDDPSKLAQHRRPELLGGTGKDPVFSISSDCLGTYLFFREDLEDPRHGFVEPMSVVELYVYRRALCDTAPTWSMTHDKRGRAL